VALMSDLDLTRFLDDLAILQLRHGRTGEPYLPPGSCLRFLIGNLCKPADALLLRFIASVVGFPYPDEQLEEEVILVPGEYLSNGRVDREQGRI
jgi:hypothetical protein